MFWLLKGRDFIRVGTARFVSGHGFGRDKQNLIWGQRCDPTLVPEGKGTTFSRATKSQKNAGFSP
jgi:hypothetical protein